MMRWIAAGLVTVMAAGGCARRPTNDDCEWPPEPPLSLDLAKKADQQHLWDDVAFAEELSIRYSDAQRGPAYGRLGRQCVEPLLRTIASTHRVALEQVHRARGHRNKYADGAVVLAFASFYTFIAGALVRRIRRRFDDSAAAAFVALIMSSFALSAAGVQVGELWAVLIEMIRVGNDHLGGRGLRIPWIHHRLELFAGGVLLFWLMTALSLSSRRPASSLGHPVMH